LSRLPDGVAKRQQRTADGTLYDLTDPAIQERLTRPEALLRIAPNYPPNAISNARGGEVVLGGIIERGGRMSNVKVLRSEPVRGFDEAALEAFRQWTFQPARVDGRFARSYHCMRMAFNVVG